MRNPSDFADRSTRPNGPPQSKNFGYEPYSGKFSSPYVDPRSNVYGNFHMPLADLHKANIMKKDMNTDHMKEDQSRVDNMTVALWREDLLMEDHLMVDP